MLVWYSDLKGDQLYTYRAPVPTQEGGTLKLWLILTPTSPHIQEENRYIFKETSEVCF